jgi:hypothetical protein
MRTVRAIWAGVAVWVACAAGCGGEASQAEPPRAAAGADMAPLPRFAAAGGGGGSAGVVVPDGPADAFPVAPPPPSRAVVVSARTPSGPPRGVGRPIDLDVKNADIAEVCRFLADTGGVNVVIGDGVGGTVTVRLKHVPWDTALEAILHAKGYRAERDGNIITVLAK